MEAGSVLAIAIAMAMKGRNADAAAIWFANKVMEEGSFAADASNEGSGVAVARIPLAGGGGAGRVVATAAAFCFLRQQGEPWLSASTHSSNCNLTLAARLSAE